MIFVQIASYRDPELLPTIQDALSKAKYPADLRFGVCWQHGPEETAMNVFAGNSQFRVDDVPWRQSNGLGWARSRLQKMWEGEEFTMQLDSHHRFAQDWDDLFIKDCEATGSLKPILTTYAGTYDPSGVNAPATEPYCMVAEKFTPSGTILFMPRIIQGWQDLTRPLNARFVSGHFYFTLGRHCEEYRYDPQLYFAGDEISLAIRSFTSGYDLFHPHRLRVWHEYTRAGRVKHWDDHLSQNELVAWHERDAVSKRRLRKLLKEEDNDEDISGHDLGTVRSHHDYELYAGINFNKRTLHADAVKGIAPPCTYIDGHNWDSSFLKEHTVDLKWNASDIGSCTDLKFVYFAIECAEGKVLHRFDADAESPEAKKQTYHKTVQFLSSSSPARFIIWPVSHSKGWLDKVVHVL